jgi:hypothetical protein
MLQTLSTDFGQYKMRRTHVFHWVYKLKSSVTTTENAEDSERPPTNKTDENVNQMQES